MNESRRRFAADLYTASHSHDQSCPDRLDRFRNVEPPTAELLAVLLRASAAHRILELGTEDAALTLAQSPDSAWDFIFLDAERPAYTTYLPDLVRTLAPAGLLAVDNAHSHEHELVDFTSLIEAEPTLTQTVVPVGAGLRLAVRDVGGGGRI
jgi:predicted O-methyltransferase YrrM